MDENYQFYKKYGVCPQCGIRDLAPGRARCEICLAQNAESAAKKRAKETDDKSNDRKQKMRYYNRSIRSDRKENGKCIWCGKPLSAYSLCFCPDCRVKNQRNNERRKSAISRSERPLYGICYRCGKNPVISGKKLCQTCYEQNIKALSLADKSEKTVERRNYIRKQNNLIFGN